MPISAEKMKRYPGGSIRSPEWIAFRAKLLARAGNRCEGTPQFPDCRAANGELHPKTGSKVVLTIAHMDQDEGHADETRCRALCQRCHNAWDAPHRQKNARQTRHRKVGQDDLFPQQGAMKR
ncbi:MAG: hypothetical protein DI527_00480 [Chelatococcus sp.]|nr:MAG: hypothetical protein DI527_00480 [Chelatococcus sp.]